VLGSKVASGTVVEGVPRDALRHFSAGFLGHIHKPQTVVKNVYYVGSPFQQHWGEAGENKRLAIFDTDTHAVTWVPMDTYGFPYYYTVTTDDFYARVDATVKTGSK
jgi:DNA repair exonuclease SbcCD nuclease subunit